jgi:protoporphyrinogen oxidase
VIIIGAGVAGLTVAYELSKHNYNILMLEREPELGGMVSSYRLDDLDIEKYYHHFFSRDSNLLNLVNELDLKDKIVWRNAPTGYYFAGKIFNLNTPFEILNSDFLNFFDKFKLGLALFRLKMIKEFSYLDDVSAKDWIIRNTSNRVFENFFKPLLRSKFGDYEDISAAWLCERIRKRANKNFFGEKLGYFRGGFNTFFGRMLKKIDKHVTIVKNSSVERILLDNNKVKGVVSGGKEHSSDQIVSTVGIRVLRSLVDLPPILENKLNELDEQRLVCCLFGLKKSVIRPYWLNLSSETLPFNILVEHNNFVNFDEYRNIRLVYAITYCDGENWEFFKIPDNDIISLYLKALEREFNLNSKDVLWWRISRASEAGLIYKIGVHKYIPDIESGISGLYLTGMLRSYPDRGINESIKDAQDCTKIILNKKNT